MKNIFLLILVTFTLFSCKKDNQFYTYKLPIIPIPDNLVVDPVFIGKWKLVNIVNLDDDEFEFKPSRLESKFIDFKINMKLDLLTINALGDIDKHQTIRDLPYKHKDGELSFTLPQDYQLNISEDKVIVYTYQLKNNSKLELTLVDGENTIIETYEPAHKSISLIIDKPNFVGIYELKNTYELNKKNEVINKIDEENLPNIFLELKQSLLFNIVKFEDEMIDYSESIFNKSFSYSNHKFFMDLEEISDVAYSSIDYSIEKNGDLTIMYSLSEEYNRKIEVYKKSDKPSLNNYILTE